MTDANRQNAENLVKIIYQRLMNIDLTEFTAIAGEIVLSDIQENIFGTLGALGAMETHDGDIVKWEPLKPGTIEQREKRKYWPGMILQRKAGSAGLVGSIFRRSDKTSATIGTNLRYAKIHQFGGVINHPGGTPYIMTKNGAVFISKRKAEQLSKPKPTKKTGKNPLLKKSGFRFIGSVKYTKPHKIEIPARRFLFLSKRALLEIRAEFQNWVARKISD